jgi:hypothetical protein
MGNETKQEWNLQCEKGFQGKETTKRDETDGGGCLVGEFLGGLRLFPIDSMD